MDTLMALVGLLIAFIAAWLFNRKSVESRHKLNTARKDVKAYETRNEVENRVARDADVKQRLRDDWSE